MAFNKFELLVHIAINLSVLSCRTLFHGKYFDNFSSFQAKMQSATKLKKILQDSKESAVESDVQNRMQPLKDQLTSTINHLHTVFETHVFIAICRGYWDRMGQVRLLVSIFNYFGVDTCSGS